MVIKQGGLTGQGIGRYSCKKVLEAHRLYYCALAEEFGSVISIIVIIIFIHFL